MRIFAALTRVALLLCLVFGGYGATVDLLSGPYSGCPGSGCAHGNYRFGTDATVSSGSWTLTTSSSTFTNSDVGKRGVAMDWHAGNGSSSPGGTCWSGYACYQGRSVQFTVLSVNSPTSIQVSPVAGGGSSGIGFNASGNAYWAVYTDDSTPLKNAISAASGGTLTVPGNYRGGIFNGSSLPANTTISCAPGASFFDPRFDSSTTYILTMGSHSTVKGCTFRGTEPSSGAYYDVLREYNIFIGVFGADGATLQNNTFQDSWGTYMVGTSGSSNWHVTNNVFKNCGLNGIQTNKTGGSNPGTYIDHNTLENCNIDGEDGSGATGSPNMSQYFQYNYVYLTGQGGVGYYRTQVAGGKAYTAAVNLSVGVAASGGRPYAGEYAGVHIDYNTVCGLHSKLMPCPNGGCSYTTFYGQEETGNTCTNGCNNTAVTSACPLTVSGAGATGGGSTGGVLPTITGFSANPATISSGSSSTLSWSTTNATSLSINQGVGTVTGLTSKSVSPTANTTYILTASNSSGTATASTTVAVSSTGPAGAPTISAFSCSPNSVTAGSTTTCSWTVANATTLSINQGVGVVTGTSKVLTPPASLTYTLTATNASGSTSANAAVSVSIGPSLGTAASGSWPTVATQQDLFKAADHAQTTLASAITNSTLTVPLAAASTFVPYQVITVDSEQMEICSLSGTTATICTGTRGLAGTSATAHNSGALIKGGILAIYHNRARNEIKAVETDFHSNHPGYGHFGSASINGSCWPNKVADDGCLFVATDNAVTTLSSSVTNSGLSLSVASSTWFVASEIILVENELMKVCSVSTGAITICSGGRGFDGTAAVAHNSGVTASSVIAFQDFFAVANEWVALEADTFGNTGSTVSGAGTASAGVSWPNHPVTLAELGLDANPGTVTSAMQNRLTAEIIAYQTDVHAHP